MKCALIQKAQKLSAALLPSLVLTIAQSSAQNVEVFFRLDVTVWPDSTGQQTEHRRIYDGRCIFGTNGWLIEGEFSLNAKETWWSNGTNIFEVNLITKELPESLQTRTATGLLTGPRPRIGERFSRMYGPSDRQPLDAMAYFSWLTFCSGSFLRSEGHRILPLSPEREEEYSDKTRVFHDALGLPESVEIYGHNKELVCSYQVLQTTNVSGWIVPVQFELTENYPSKTEAPKVWLRGAGTVTSIHDSAGPPTPANR